MLLLISIVSRRPEEALRAAEAALAILPAGPPDRRVLSASLVGRAQRRDGLDLRHTKPPVAECRSARVSRPEPLAALRGGLELSELSIHGLAGATGRHGIFLGAKRWHA